MTPAFVPRSLAPGDLVRLADGRFPFAKLRTGRVVRLAKARPTCGACKEQVLIKRDGEAPDAPRFWPVDAWERVDA